MRCTRRRPQMWIFFFRKTIRLYCRLVNFHRPNQLHHFRKGTQELTLVLPIGKEACPMSAPMPGSQIHFLSLPTAIFCVQCELISANTTPACLACGSKAVLSLSRLMGGSLRSQPLARVIHDDELNRIVRDLLFTIPGGEITTSQIADQADVGTECESSIFARRECDGDFLAPKFQLEPAIGVITERAQALTGATGAAIALRSGDEIVCRARA